MLVELEMDANSGQYVLLDLLVSTGHAPARPSIAQVRSHASPGDRRNRHLSDRCSRIFLFCGATVSATEGENRQTHQSRYWGCHRATEGRLIRRPVGGWKSSYNRGWGYDAAD